jgi:DNA-binding NarL/FixJ family response regulator
MFDGGESIVVIEALGLARECLCAMLSEITAGKVVGVCDEFEVAINSVKTLLPRLVLVSTTILGISATDFIRRVKRTYPQMLVLALIGDKKENLIPQSLRAGADGYILDGVTHENFSAAIRSALRGKSYTTADKSTSVLAHELEILRKSVATGANPRDLTPREREVLILVANAQSNKGIAKCLGLSVNTVEKHRASLMRKLGVHNAAGLTAHAIATGLTTAVRADDLVSDGMSPMFRAEQRAA